jgi:3-oxoacyl-[acyl-carrier-protein] synthase III
MAKFSIKGIGVKGICASVPLNKEDNIDYPYLNKEDINKLIELTGIQQRRVAPAGMCTSDLCLAAAEKLISELQWQKSEIEVLVFVSQTPDYILPITAPILQDKLGLPKSCIAFDVPLGCSGYVYGLSITAGMMKASGLKKGLLLCGDTITKYISTGDKSAKPLFGDAGSATALACTGDSDDVMHFDLGTDGSGYKTIMIPDGGTRNPVTKESLEDKIIEEGISRNNCQLVLEGMDVFSFGITTVPKAVAGLMEHFSLNTDNVDYFVFHQANLMMNKMIVKKLKLPPIKVPYSLQYFGNTSSATIPLTIVSQLRDAVTNGNKKLVLCGFGVGLSWGTVYIETNNLVAPPVIEL